MSAGSSGTICRFTVAPRAGGLLRPAFRVSGLGPGRVSVNVDGLALRGVCRLADGSALFEVRRHLRRPARVEVRAARN
jgi:hypothetical protein